MKFKNDVLLYAMIAGLTALIASHDPLDWRQLASVALSICIGVKAKLSPDKESDEKNQTRIVEEVEADENVNPTQ